MLINCNSCKKKFSVPDSAITEDGRLLQCGFCGSKWTQYPVKEKLLKKNEKINPIKVKQSTNINKIKTSTKKKKREINLYSEEYLKKKYGLTIKNPSNGQDKKQNKSNFSFYNYLITISIFTITFFGILNLTKDVIIESYPAIIPYIDYLYENIDTLRIKISELVNQITFLNL